jgi:hypothetical protein
MQVSEKALALILWQPRQWQAAVMIGGAVIAIVVRPQRQWPESGASGEGRGSGMGRAPAVGSRAV